MNKVLIKLAFVLSFLWWIYLFFVTEMVVVFDSEGYEYTGRLIYTQGWQEFFHSGPQREPFFSALIALCMWLGNILHVSYFYPLKAFGIVFLFLTMVLVCRLMKMLGIRPSVGALTILYLGFSPVMTNSSMRVWSEFAMYPWVVLGIWWTVKSWMSIETWTPDKRGFTRAAVYGGVLGIIFLLMMSVKAVAEAVLICYLWPFYGQIFLSWRSKNKFRMKQVIVFCVMVLLVFEGSLAGYKWVNYVSNGNYTYTTRWDWALWGYAKRRAEPMTAKKLEAAVLFVPGMGICTDRLGQEQCDFWSTTYSDRLDSEKREELVGQGLDEKKISAFFVGDSIKLMISHSLQQLGLMLIEAHKIFFWESSIAFVAYPDWLENIFYSNTVMNMLKIILAVLGWLASVYAVGYLWPRRTVGLSEKEKQATVLFTVNFIFWFTAMYSVYFIVDRYIFPIVSLLLVLIAFGINQIVIAIRGYKKS